MVTLLNLVAGERVFIPFELSVCGTCGADTVRWLARTRGEQYVEVNYDLFRFPEQAQAFQVFVPRWSALGEPRPRL